MPLFGKKKVTNCFVMKLTVIFLQQQQQQQREYDQNDPKLGDKRESVSTPKSDISALDSFKKGKCNFTLFN